MRCTRCGNDNPGENRFCGMCGTPLLSPAAVAETQTRRAASGVPIIPSAPVTTTSRPVETPRTVARVPEDPPDTRVIEDSPGISGPSFLGLNNPAPRKRARLSIDPHSGSGARGVDYLLDDEEEHRGGGGGKFLIILFALALAAGLGYLRWRNQGLGWLTGGTSKPSAAAQNPSEPESTSPAPAATAPAATSAPPNTAAPAQSQPANPVPTTTSQPATNSTPASDQGDENPSTATPSGTAPTGPAPAGTPAGTPAAANPTPHPADAKHPPASADDDDTADNADEPVNPAAKPARIDKPNAAREAVRPRTPPQPARTSDAVSEAQRYLYGRGAAQDCDQGLRILKPAANQANPRAMIQMGALYSAGLCTPRDLPTAYRWFALALRKEPDNQAVQTDLQKLWGEMTQPERQLAIKLSQ